MPKTYSVAEARANLPRILDEVESGGEVELTRRGKAVAVVIAIDEFERMSSGRRDFGKAYAAYRKRHEGLRPEVLAGLRSGESGRKVIL